MISEICHCSIGNSFLLSLFGVSLPGEGWDSEQGAIGEKEDSVRPMGGKPEYVA